MHSHHPRLPVECPPPTSSDLGRAVTRPPVNNGDSKTKAAANGHRSPQIPEAPGSLKVDIPPTPAPSPRAPIPGASAGVSTENTSNTGSVSLPKPTLGLRFSRWATDDDPITERQAQVTKPISGSLEKKATERQISPQSPSSDHKVDEATQAFSNLTLKEDSAQKGYEMKPKTERIDPMTGKSLDPEFVRGAKAWLSSDEVTQKVVCGLYLSVKGSNCPLLGVVVQGGRKTSHNLLDLLSQTLSGVLLDLAFRERDNKITWRSLEFETEKGAAEFAVWIEDLRKLSVEALQEEVKNFGRGSSDDKTGKGNGRLHLKSTTRTIRTASYLFAEPTRKKWSSTSEATCTDTLQAPLIPVPHVSPARLKYTQEQLTRLRGEARAAPSTLIELDFMQAVKAAAAKRRGHTKSASEECVVGMVQGEHTSRDIAAYQNKDRLLDVRKQVQESMAKGDTWLSQNVSAGL